MTCREAHGLLLEADPADLRGEGDSPLAMHVRNCDRCRARAALTLGAQERLADALSGRRPCAPLDSAVERAAVEARRRRSRRRLAWRAGPALAAAALAAVLVWRSQSADGRAPVAPGEGRAATPGPPPVLVQAPPDRDVVIFATGNPDIVVVWLY